nr:unnamed protein product [Digitaria exilis]
MVATRIPSQSMPAVTLPPVSVYGRITLRWNSASTAAAARLAGSDAATAVAASPARSSMRTALSMASAPPFPSAAATTVARLHTADAFASATE